MPSLSFGQEFLCGWAGGAAGVVASHPLDIMRTQIQTRPDATLSSAALQLRREGWRGLLRGLLSPLLLIGSWKAVVLASTTEAQKRFYGTDQKPTLSQLFLTGMVGGMAGHVVQMPMDRVKCVAQVAALPPSLRNELSFAYQIGRTEGFWGLYRGLGINLLPCSVATGVWLSLNEWLLQTFGPADADGRTVGQQFVCGGIAGCAGWAVNYPADKAKAIVQVSAGLSAESRAASSLALLRPALRAEGPSFLWRGAMVTICRGLPFNGACMLVYSRVRAVISDRRTDDG